MSLFSKLWKGVRKIAEPIIRATPIGAAVGTAYDALRGSRAPSAPSATMSLLPAAVGAGRAIIPRAVQVGKRVLPGVVGAGATQAVLDRVTVTGRRAAAPRRRARGITAAELRGFKRVNGILDKYAKVKPPTRPRSYGGSRKCR